MTAFWLVMLGGLLGSSHIVGMSDHFSANDESRPKSLPGSVLVPLLCCIGRLISYSVLGAIAGFAGQRASQLLPKTVDVAGILCLLACLCLVCEGMMAIGIIHRRRSDASPTKPLFSTNSKIARLLNTLASGITAGLLPSGLVIAFVLLAASTDDLVEGSKTMLAFGLGTLPLTILVQCGPTILNWTGRQRVWRLAGWSAVTLGGSALVYGVALLQPLSSDGKPPVASRKSPSNMTPQPQFGNPYAMTDLATQTASEFRLFLPK